MCKELSKEDLITGSGKRGMCQAGEKLLAELLEYQFWDQAC